ncbi:hypothetical protein L7F22_000952 [Adiantum nelumboides]|nr:hypothetical protein [Adiantum nelumboides]
MDTFHKKITSVHRGKTHVLDVKLRGESIPVVSASAISAVMKNHLFAYLIFAKEVHEVESNLFKLDKDRAAFLNGFSHCFSDSLPDELPPGRPEDHRIDLVPGSSPPYRPPYRVKLLSRSLFSEAQTVSLSPQHACSVPYRAYGISAAQQEISSERGHAVLAPFTAAHQVTDSNPLVIERSEGAYVFDSNGKKYFDSLAGLWCTSLGGHEPRLVAAATNQMNKLPFYHSFWNRITKPALDLSKELLELFTPAQMSKVFFTNDGSEANDTQAEIAAGKGFVLT